jgi:hypothetical protein
MNSYDPAKVFDISGPRPTPTSRPIIVGHRPTMSDPMMKRAPAPKSAARLEGTPPHVPPESHLAKSIAVSEEMHASITSAAQPLANISIPPEPSTEVPAPISATPDPANPGLGPSPIAVAPAVAPLQPVPEPHFQSLPLSHSPASSLGLRALFLWLAVVIFLAAAGVYLALDSNLVSNNIKLPFHIFGGQ